MKKIEDYLHLYIGQTVARDHNGLVEYAYLAGVCKSEVEKYKWVSVLDVGIDHFHEWYVEETKPILRPLSDMTEDEMRELYKIMGEPSNTFCYPVTHVKWGSRIEGYQPNIIDVRYEGSHGGGGGSGHYQILLNRIDSKSFLWLLSKGFDLFGLIESGLAIDKTKR